MANERILVIEDEKNLAKLLKYNLEKEGYRVSVCGDGEAGLAAFNKEKPDLVILDLMLPKLNGFDFCKAVRKESETPIIMLTARKEEVDRVLGLEMGADDYVTKPFSVRELLARIRVILRRASPKEEARKVLRAGKLELDLDAYEVRLEGRAIALSTKEFDFLKCLLQSRGKALTRD